MNDKHSKGSWVSYMYIALASCPNHNIRKSMQSSSSSPSLRPPRSMTLILRLRRRRNHRRASSHTIPYFRSSSTKSYSSRSSMQALVTLRRRRSSEENTRSHARLFSSSHSKTTTGQRIIPALFHAIPAPKPECTPNNTASSFNQAGGHDGTFRNHGSSLVKRVNAKEAQFYQLAQTNLWPCDLIPKYFGTLSPHSISIENLTHGYKRPCVIDLKMGVQTFEDDGTSFFKKLRMNALDHVTRSKSEGCRLEGLSMYKTIGQIKGSKVQSHSASMHPRVWLTDILTFFLTDESGVRCDVALRFQHMIEHILKQFETNTSFRFIGSSILLIYDNDNRAPYQLWARALRNLHRINPNVRVSEQLLAGLTRRTSCDVRMIDFAHWSYLPENTRDEGYIIGLKTILKALHTIRMYRARPVFSVGGAVSDVLEQQRGDEQNSSSSTSWSSMGTAASGGCTTDRAMTKGETTKQTTREGAATEGNAFNFDMLWREMRGLGGLDESVSCGGEVSGEVGDMK